MMMEIYSVSVQLAYLISTLVGSGEGCDCTILSSTASAFLDHFGIRADAFWIT